MPDYKKLYFILLRDVSDISKRLIEVQQKMEEIYLQEPDDATILTLHNPEKDND
ncbi:MAG: hypothetical protein ACERKO_05130 [Acetanaerobacterium sp.]